MTELPIVLLGFIFAHSSWSQKKNMKSNLLYVTVSALKCNIKTLIPQLDYGIVSLFHVNQLESKSC